MHGQEPYGRQIANRLAIAPLASVRTTFEATHWPERHPRLLYVWSTQRMLPQPFSLAKSI